MYDRRKAKGEEVAKANGPCSTALPLVQLSKRGAFVVFLPCLLPLHLRLTSNLSWFTCSKGQSPRVELLTSRLHLHLSLSLFAFATRQTCRPVLLQSLLRDLPLLTNQCTSVTVHLTSICTTTLSLQPPQPAWTTRLKSLSNLSANSSASPLSPSTWQR